MALYKVIRCKTINGNQWFSEHSGCLTEEAFVSPLRIQKMWQCIWNEGHRNSKNRVSLRKTDPHFPKVLPTIGCVDLSSPAHRRNYPRQNLLKKGWKFRNSCSVACTSPPRSLWELIRLGSGPDPGTLRNPNYLKTDKIEPDHWEWPKNSFDQLRIAWELNRI